MNEMITYEAPLLRGRFIVFNERPEFEFLKVKQTHSDIVLPEDQCSIEQVADGIVGNSALPKVILTADCLPIVLIGPEDHVVIHAGWRGLAKKILSNPLVKSINPTYAFIGPHIRKESYEVQEDFKQNFLDFPEAFSTKDRKIFFDMSMVATLQLKKDYPSIAVVDSGLCTYSDLKFHSYRRDQTTKRNWNIYFPKYNGV